MPLVWRNQGNNPSTTKWNPFSISLSSQKVAVSIPNDAIKAAKKRNRAHRGFTLGRNQVFVLTNIGF
jgi:hypothetical protein